jgi:thiazole synthase
MILLPLLAGFFIARKFKLSFKDFRVLFVAGALTFIASQVIHVPLVFGLTALFSKGLLPSMDKSVTLIFNAIVLGLLAGIFEETARYILFKWIRKSTDTWRNGIVIAVPRLSTPGGRRPMLQPMSFANRPLTIAGHEFKSRLILGTGKFSSPANMREALDASGAEMVTVALRRADLSGKHDPFANILEFLDPKRYVILPNTSGAMNAEEAVRLARLARAAGLPNWVKLEIHPDPRYLLPDPVETLKAAEILVKEGFVVLPYINADPVLAKRLQDAGAATVMPLGSPIGSNRGIQTRDQIRIIIEQATVPVVVDAGIGAPSHAAEAMELGADAVLVNTAIAVASDPIAMARAFAKAIEAGRTAFEIGLGAQLDTASATSPLTAFLDQS